MAPRGFGDLGRMAIYFFRDLRSTVNFFRGAGEQAHSFGDIVSPAKKQREKKVNKEKASILFGFSKNFFYFFYKKKN